MTYILGFSGRKQSGKNTVCNFLHGMQMVHVGLVPDFRFTNDGRLLVPVEEEDDYGVFDLDRKDPEFIDYMCQNIWPFIKTYSFADLLKSNICIDVLGLSYDQCYGTDKDKNTKTHILWNNILGSTNKGKMTAREVMQFVGTDFFRKLYPNVWSDATIRQIQAEGTALAVVSDCRFPNEVEAIKKAGGKVIRLNRNNHGDDNHDSETALDKENFDWKNFDMVIDNQNMDVKEANEKVYSAIREWGLIDMDYEVKEAE